MTPDDYRIRRRGCAIFAGVFTVIFALCVIPGWLMVWGPWFEYRSSDGWVGTACTVTTSRSILGARNKRYFRFAYEYTVDGRTWTGHRYTFTDRTAGSGQPPLLTLGQHRCFYDPAEPSESVIERSYDPTYRYVGIGLLLASFISLFAIGQWIRYYRNPQLMRFLT